MATLVALSAAANAANVVSSLIDGENASHMWSKRVGPHNVLGETWELLQNTMQCIETYALQIDAKERLQAIRTYKDYRSKVKTERELWEKQSALKKLRMRWSARRAHEKLYEEVRHFGWKFKEMSENAVLASFDAQSRRELEENAALGLIELPAGMTSALSSMISLELDSHGNMSVHSYPPQPEATQNPFDDVNAR